MSAEPNRSRLVLNVSPVSFADGEIRVGLLPYRDREQLKELRIRHQGTHVFRRRDDLVQVVAVKEGAEELGGRFETLPLVKDLRLTAVLIREALLNYLAGLGRTILDYDPLTFIAAGRSDDLLTRALPPGEPTPPWLSVAPRFEASVRVFHFDDRAPFVGCALDVSAMRRILARCDALIGEGLDIRGLYVRAEQQSGDRRLTARSHLVGRVTAVNDDRLSLDDARDDQPSVSSRDVTLVTWPDAFRRCFSHAFGSQAREFEERLSIVLAGIHTGPSKLARIREVTGYLSRQRLELAPGISFCLGEPLAQGRAKQFPRVQTAPKPTYVFDPTGARTETWHDRGLRSFGPYTSKVFTPSQPRIGVVCQGRFKGQVEQMLHRFLHGVPAPNPEKAPFAQGFIRKYALENCSVEVFTTTDASVPAYDRTIRDLLRAHGQRGPKFDLVLIQIEERFHELQGGENPYLVTKAVLLSQQLPVQEFEIESVSAVSATQLGYTLNNMALACYAKLGGIPWLVQANPTIAHELVIGLGSAAVGSGRLGTRQRIVGITTVFTGDGRYHLSNLSQAVPADEFSGALRSSLTETVERVRRDFNWQQGERIRLVFHAFKDFKDTEADAVKGVMDGLAGYDVEYAFLHVADHHPVVVFDELQPGIPDAGGRGKKGVFAPRRGQFFRVSASEVLLTLTGPNEVKQASDGLRGPILLKLHRRSTFTDTTYLTRQVLTFASHSWRSFFPSPMPVTILYSELVARLLTQLIAVEPGIANALLGRIGTTRWFL